MAGKTIAPVDAAWNVAKGLVALVGNSSVNPVWSPASVCAVLEVLALGSSGETRKELDGVLGCGRAAMTEDPYALVSTDRWKSDDYRASIVKGLWLAQKATPDQGFVEGCERHGVDVTWADLSDPSSETEIAHWIEIATEGLLSPDISLPPDALACVVSALYLKDAWEEPFEDGDTEVGIFHAASGDVKCAYMRGRRRCELLESDGLLAMSLRLSAGGRLVFAIGSEEPTPDATESLPALEEVARRGGTVEEVLVYVPRFACDTESVDLVGALRSAGVSTAASMDLGPMVGTSPCPMGLAHGARLAVDERGIEAGAYTMAAAAEGIPDKDPRVVVLDRPFLVALVSQNGSPLFLGRVDRPSENVLVWKDAIGEEEWQSIDEAWAMGRRYKLSDEEVEGWCRVTVEEDQPRDVFEITCSIYGAMVHTVFAADYSEAYGKAEGIKRDLEEFVMGSKSDAPFNKEGWIRSFVERWS